MELKIISAKDLNSFIAAIINSGMETYGVQEKEEGKFHFAQLKNAHDLRLDYDVTLSPPKKFFFPEKEALFKYKMAPEIKTTPLFETNKRVIIGIHPYDMIAINQLDLIFEDKNEDMHYLKRRRNTVIIGVDPQSASSWAFWCLMDAGKVDHGYDIWLTKLDENTYFMEVATDAGKGLASKFARANDAKEEHINKRDHIRAGLHSVCNRDRKMKAMPGEIPLLIKNNWDHPTWEKRAKKCTSCGSCNLVCPTCYCFDVGDEVELNLKDGRRIRLWDGCQLEDFAVVGHGENFRGKRLDRFRHRFYRKTVYQYERYNQLACIGCGRCGSVCLPNIADPVDIINTIKGEDK